ncbi:MAG: ferredoxin [Halorubrum sp. J07HR59]|nr:MAG: ferredoxin [Halorubrum sp. J07HR59]
MVEPLAVGVAAAVTMLVVLFHFMRGTGWEAADDISDEILEQRRELTPETDFPEPMNRALGAGGGGSAAVGGGAEGAELDGESVVQDEPGPADIPEDEVEYHEVEFLKEGETVELANNQTILEQGEESGWDLPYACRQGQCVSCAGQVQDGPSEDFLTHDDQQMLDDDELADGYTLTCVAYPRDSFAIETGETP